MPKQGVKSTFTFGMNYGIWIGSLRTLDIDFIKIQARQWQEYYEIPKQTNYYDRKKALKEKATQPKLARGKPLGKPRGHGGPELVAPKKPRKRKLSRGGLTKAGHKDYRKGGMFY